MAVIALVIGAVAGFAFGRGGIVGPSPEVTKLRAQVEEAKKLFPPLPEDIRSVSGTVKEISGDLISIETFSANPFDETPRMRSITADSGTEITRNQPKDSAAYQRELDQYQKSFQSAKPGSNLPVPPNPFREVSIDISDIKVGDQIVALANENIRDRMSFKAKSISVSGVAGPAGIPGGVIPPAPPPPAPSASGPTGSIPPAPPPPPRSGAPAGAPVPPPPPVPAR